MASRRGHRATSPGRLRVRVRVRVLPVLAASLLLAAFALLGLRATWAAGPPGPPGPPAGGRRVAAAAAATPLPDPVPAPAPAATPASVPSVPSVRGPGKVSIIQVAGREVDVYRPAVPDAATLPVVYFLHGVPGTASDVFNAGLTAALDQAFASGSAPFVVASPDGNGDQHDDTEWANAVDGSDQLETFVINKVIAAVEGNAPRDAAHRAIAGDSMGGYGAMNLALRHPGVFSQVVSLAGYFHVDDPEGVFGDQAAVIAANSPDQHVAAATGLHILLADGTEESDPAIEGESQRFADLLTKAGIPVTLHLEPGGDTWTFASSQFGLMTQFLETGFSR